MGGTLSTIQFAPIDVPELVKAIFYGIGALCLPLATAYIMIGAARAKRAEAAATTAAVTSAANGADISKVKDNVALIERNTNSISARNEEIARKLGIQEGIEKNKRHTAEAAEQLAEGHRQGVDAERATVALAAEAAAPERKD